MTITEHLEFSVVSAPLAQIDRRALSQAWYSALYSQGSHPTDAPASHERSAAPEPAALKTSNGTATHAAQPQAPHSDRRVQTAAARATATGVDRRAACSPLARRIERRFLRPGVPPKQATLQLEGGRGRVQILFRQSGEQMRIVAICANSARTRVAEALAQARYTLAARGIALQSEIREVGA